MKKFRVACVQSNAVDDVERNMKQAAVFIRQAASRRALLIAFPEAFLFRGRSSAYGDVARKTETCISIFCSLAKTHHIAILLGSVLEPSPQKNHYFNTSIFISEKGRVKARYRKLHLFDVRTPRGTMMKESKWIVQGKKIVSLTWKNARLGFSICYDVRFPELFRTLVKRNSTEIIFVPSNFLEETGKAHWHALLRARAIENQVFIVAPAQSGKNVSTGKKSFGHALIVDPWGRVLAESGGVGKEILTAGLDLSFLRRIRKDFPVLSG